MTRLRSFLVALLTLAMGLLLWGWDDWLIPPELQGSTLHRVLAIGEFAVLVPGMGVLGFMVCEYVRVSQAALRQERERARQQRLVALGRVARGLAHEVRNPMHNIRLLVEEARDAEAGERARLLDRADANLDRIDRAVELVYRLARPRTAAALQDGVADLPRLIDAAVAEERTRMPAVELAWPGGRPAMAACPDDDVRIVLDNLLRNATAAAGGEPVRISLGRNGSAWIVTVANRGRLPPWFSNDDEGEFTTSKPGGLGLGLSISRQLVIEAGGRLALVQHGDSVEARLELPAAAEAT